MVLGILFGGLIIFFANWMSRERRKQEGLQVVTGHL
jgi:hypothetical protein